MIIYKQLYITKNIINNILIISNYKTNIIKKKGEIIMAINQLESTLQAITNSIIALENSKNPDEQLLKELRKERDNILAELNIN